MSIDRRSLTSNAARIATGVLALALLVALLATVFLSRGSIDDAEAQAQTRAVGWANAVLFDALTPEQVTEPILGPDYRELLITVQAGILSDDRAARVRIWNTDGELIFSDDQRDKIGEFVAQDNPQIEAALAGGTVSVPTDTSVAPKSGLAGSDERLFQTFVPLRLVNQLGVSGVVQIDQRYSRIEAAASDVWQTVRLALVIALTLAVALFLFTLRARPAEVRAGDDDAAVPSRQDRKALERMAKTEDELRAAVSRAETAEAVAAETEATVGEAVTRVRELEDRAARAEERAASAEASLQEAAQRATGGETPRRGVPGVGVVAAGVAASELEARLRTAEGDREQLAGEVGRLRAALSEREAKLAIAREGATTGDAEIGKVRQLAVEHEGRTAEVEERAVEAERRATDAEARIGVLEAKLGEAEAAAATVTAADAKRKTKGKEEQKAATELRAAQLELNDLKMKLAEAETGLANAQGKLASHGTSPSDLEAHARTTKELEVARAALAKGDAELAAARSALAASEKGSVDVKAVEERAAASEARATEAETKLAAAEKRATAVETKLKEVEEIGGALATELETLRAERAKPTEAAAKRAAAPAADVSELQARIAELEEARRNDVAELQRAQEALANTQFEATQVQRHAKDLEDRIKKLQAAPAPEPTPAVEVPDYVTEQGEGTSFSSRLASLVREHESGAPTESGEPPPAADDEEALSLRERLARAAAARHRAPNAPGPEEK